MSVLNQQNKPTNPRELKDYQRYIKSTINDLIEEESYKQFLAKSTEAFEEGLHTFLR
jgi:hypothetical protein